MEPEYSRSGGAVVRTKILFITKSLGNLMLADEFCSWILIILLIMLRIDLFLNGCIHL